MSFLGFSSVIMYNYLCIYIYIHIYIYIYTYIHTRTFWILVRSVEPILGATHTHTQTYILFFYMRSEDLSVSRLVGSRVLKR